MQKVLSKKLVIMMVCSEKYHFTSSCPQRRQTFHSLIPQMKISNEYFRNNIFKYILIIIIKIISKESTFFRILSIIASTLVQVMAWCHQAPNHYLNQCWPRSMAQYYVNKGQWVIEPGKWHIIASPGHNELHSQVNDTLLRHQDTMSYTAR